MTKGEINYKNGKIYKIERICEHDEGDVYIGSTTKQYLSQRMTAHRANYKSFKIGKYHKIMTYDLFDKYGIENCDIILLESVEANSKDELHTREAHYIKTIKCVNRNVPTRTAEERKEIKKDYNKDNKEKLKQHREDVKDLKKEYDKIYRDNKKDIMDEKVKCQCGSEYMKRCKNRHEKTKKHLNYCLTI